MNAQIMIKALKFVQTHLNLLFVMISIPAKFKVIDFFFNKAKKIIN